MHLSNVSPIISSNNFVQESFGNRVETLRAVATLLLREVESLERSVVADQGAPDAEELSLPEKLERFELDTIRCALIKTNGRQKAAAKLLGLKLTTLNAKIKKHAIEWRMPESDLGLATGKRDDSAAA